MTTTVHPSTYKSPWWYLPAGVSAPGKPVGGWYKGGGADITALAASSKANIKGHTTYLSLAQFGPGQKGVQTRAWEDAFARAGGLLNVVVELKQYGAAAPSVVPAPNGVMTFQTGQKYWSWTQVLAGDLDPLLALMAASLAACPYFLNVQICSERDTDHQKGGTAGGQSFTWAQLDKLGVDGVGYILSFLRQGGVRNCSFSAGIGGWDQASFTRSFVPEVDVIQFNAYNHGAWTAADKVLGKAYGWAEAWYPTDLPMFVAEWGCQPDSGTNKQADWIKSVPAVLGDFPRIEFMSYFDSGWGTLNASGPAALAACYGGGVFL